MGSGASASPVDINVAGGRIESVAPAGRGVGADRTFDADGAWVAPGYIDIHTHGGLGADAMDATPEALDEVARFHLAAGTTSFLATTLTAPLPDIARALDALRARAARPGGRPGASILGAHLEGPFLSPRNAGAQDRRFLRGLDEEATAFVLGNADIVRRVTLAPELEGAPAFVARLRSAGIGASAGHDAAVDDEILAAVEAGLDGVTHIFCCSSGISRRSGPRKHLGLTEIGLADDRLTVEVIADRRHTPDALFPLVWRAKGRDRICLVSDSIRVAGLPDGEYALGGAEGGATVLKRGDEASLPGLGLYAGSAISLGQAVRNLVAYAGLSLGDAVHMATAVPARLLGLADRGRVAPGMAADLNLLDPAGRVLATFIGGEPA